MKTSHKSIIAVCALGITISLGWHFSAPYQMCKSLHGTLHSGRYCYLGKILGRVQVKYGHHETYTCESGKECIFYLERDKVVGVWNGECQMQFDAKNGFIYSPSILSFGETFNVPKECEKEYLEFKKAYDASSPPSPDKFAPER